MQRSTRQFTTAIILTLLFTAFGMPRCASGAAGPEGAAADPDAAAARLEDATAAAFSDASYFDGDSWVPMKLMTGSFEGPAGGASATARLKADLGGPKTYFILAGAASEAKISIARPRFRLAIEEGAARRVQLAQFETKDETRRTTIEIGKNATVFKRGAELEVTKVSEGRYEVRPKKSLQPGEYALVISEAGPVADFTIAERGY